MKTELVKALSFSALLFTSTQSLAGVIAFDLIGNNSQNLISYVNPYENSFTALSDGFQIYQIGLSSIIPEQLIDRSNSSMDELGVIEESNTDRFFGIVDTVNNDNTGEVTSSWAFSIVGFQQLSFGVDIAAMGDFETSDYFSWSYQIDDGPIFELFKSTVDESIEQVYEMANNNVSLADPMRVNAQILSNQFQTINAGIDGVGDKITLSLAAKFNGGLEIAAFKGLTISGQSNTAKTASVSEPSSYIMFSLCSILLIIRRKQKLI
ncbi:hypothetical protein [Thalassotalea atypica]|uniref:hypothetical protein n=1 Tax=Thalassotalea atypica TaxID=2054316 RepID=UPI0025725A50|nr:hypothetical protein [Thalassotalea atypica]